MQEAAKAAPAQQIRRGLDGPRRGEPVPVQYGRAGAGGRTVDVDG